jgi:hypothetical protein
MVLNLVYVLIFLLGSEAHPTFRLNTPFVWTKLTKHLNLTKGSRVMASDIPGFFFPMTSMESWDAEENH